MMGHAQVDQKWFQFNVSGLPEGVNKRELDNYFNTHSPSCRQNLQPVVRHGGKVYLIYKDKAPSEDDLTKAFSNFRGQHRLQVEEDLSVDAELALNQRLIADFTQNQLEEMLKSICSVIDIEVPVMKGKFHAIRGCRIAVTVAMETLQTLIRERRLAQNSSSGDGSQCKMNDSEPVETCRFEQKVTDDNSYYRPRIELMSHDRPAYGTASTLEQNAEEHADHGAEVIDVEQHVWNYLLLTKADVISRIAAKHDCGISASGESKTQGSTYHTVKISAATPKDAQDCSEALAALFQQVINRDAITEEEYRPPGVAKLPNPALESLMHQSGAFLQLKENCVKIICPAVDVDNVRRQIDELIEVHSNICVTPSGLSVFVIIGDLVQQCTDAIVNPANDYLAHHAGAAKAIADAAGKPLMDECKDYIHKHRTLKTTGVMHTTAGRLASRIKYVIHAVGPNAGEVKDAKKCYQLLENTFYNCLVYADRVLRINSVSIPAISAGIYAVPLLTVAEASFNALKRFDADNREKPGNLKEIYFVYFDEEMTAIMRSKMEAEWANVSLKPTPRSADNGTKNDKDAGNQSSHRSRTVQSAGMEDKSKSKFFVSLSNNSQYQSYTEEADTGSSVDEVQTRMLKNGDVGVVTVVDAAAEHTRHREGTVFKHHEDGDTRAQTDVHRSGQHHAVVTKQPIAKSRSINGVSDNVNSTAQIHNPISTAAENGSEQAAVEAEEFRNRIKSLESNDDSTSETFHSLSPRSSADDVPTKKSDQNSSATTSPTTDNASAAFADPNVDMQSNPECKSTNSADGGAAKESSDKEVEQCVICFETITKPKRLDCGHVFCEECIATCFDKCQPKCPSCGQLFGVLKGNQPYGTMEVLRSKERIPGYEKCGSIEITYTFPNGMQTAEHDNPGQPYWGTQRRAYLPDNEEGREVLGLLRRAFNARLIFTVGRSITNGRENMVVWNDVHHKTSLHGQYGYPDETYLTRVKKELAAKGIVTSSPKDQ